MIISSSDNIESRPATLAEIASLLEQQLEPIKAEIKGLATDFEFMQRRQRLLETGFSNPLNNIPSDVSQPRQMEYAIAVHSVSMPKKVKIGYRRPTY